ncbi:hypothetical protein KKA14_09150, partial [bacterium]|nr:hypothetical protein [bacterium]
RNIEDRVLLNQLAEKYPVDVEVLSALGYFYTDRGDDSRGMVYLKRAKSIPPSDPILNQSYRELSHKYSPTIFMDYLFSEKNDSDAGKEYTLEISKISGQSMVSEMDKIGYEIKYFKSNLYELETTNKEIVHDLSSDDITESEVPSVSKSDSVSKSAIDIAYFGNIAHNYDLSLIQKYEGHLYFQDKFGFKVVYSAALVSPSLTLTLSGFASMPDHEEFELVKAEAYTTGFEIEGNIFLKDLKQNYTFSYLNRTFDLYNQDYTGQPDQNRISLGVTQGLMTYPNGLNLSVNYTIYNAAGEIEQFDTATSTIVYKHLILPSVQLQVEMTFQHYWTEFFDTTISLYNYSSTTGDFTTEHKSSLSQELSSQKLRMLFSLKKDSWVISGLISYLQETQEEKREIAYTTDTETETIVGSRSSTVSEIGLSAQLFF